MRKLYYIRGDSGAPNCIKQALLNKGGINDLCLCFDIVEGIYYIDKESKIRCAGDEKFKNIIIEFGTELQPGKPGETFKPFDKVIVKFRDKGDWTVDTFSHKKGKWFYCGGGIPYSECHKYEPWMDKYLGANTPYEEFEKE